MAPEAPERGMAGGPAERPGGGPGPIGGDSLPGRRRESAGPLCWPPLTLPKKGRRCLPLRIVCPWNVYFFSVLFVRWLPLAASDCRSGSEFYHKKKKRKKKRERERGKEKEKKRSGARIVCISF